MAKKAASNRSFGVLISAVFALVAGLHYWYRGHGYIVPVILAVAFLAVSLSMPRLLFPLKRLWLKLGSVLHVVINPVVLLVLYVGSILPFGLLMRLFGKELLPLGRDPAAQSYWIRRDPPGPSAKSLRRQF